MAHNLIPPYFCKMQFWEICTKIRHFWDPMSIDSNLLSLASICSNVNGCLLLVSTFLVPVSFLHSCTLPLRSYGSHFPAPLSLITISCLQNMQVLLYD